MIKFQSGRFDNPNRMFKGINKEWKSANNNATNVKELIPEFFYLPEFLQNRSKYNRTGVQYNGIDQNVIEQNIIEYNRIEWSRI